MINLEIIASQDPFDIGNYPFIFDCVYIGSSMRADIQIEDRSLPQKFLTIKCIQEILIVKNEPHSPYYFVNGKKMSGTRKLKRGDIIAIGALQLKIIDFKKTDIEESLEQYYLTLEKEANDLRVVLDILEEKIIELEGKNSDV